MNLNLFLGVTIGLSLSACTNMPPIIRDFPATELSYQTASANPDAYRETPVRWGGTVIAVENETDFSLLQVLYYPLDRSGAPKIDLPGEGRFAIKETDFLDPAIFTRDTEITVTGTLQGSIERTVGSKTIQLPLISAETIYLWPHNYQEDRLLWSNRYYRHYGPYYPGSYGYPFFFEGFYGPYRYWW